MLVDYVTPSAFFVIETHKASAGTILFRNTYGEDHAPRLVAAKRLEMGEDEFDRTTLYFNLGGAKDDFTVRNADVTEPSLGVDGWRIEVDPASVKNAAMAPIQPGDIILHPGTTALRLLDRVGRPLDVDLTTFEVGPAFPNKHTSVFFPRWRAIKAIAGRDEPVVIFERDGAIEAMVA